MSFFNLGIEDTEIVGLTMVGMFALAVSVLLWTAYLPRMKWPSLIAQLVSIVLPSTWLALERGNVDVVIFLLASLAVFLGSRGKAASAVFLLSWATAWKVFPGIASLGFVRNWRLGVLALTTFTATGGFLLADELWTLRDRTPLSGGRSFGISVIPSRVISQDIASVRAWLAGLFILAVVVSAYAVTVRRFAVSLDQIKGRVREDEVLRISALVSCGTFLGGYVVGASYDYRLIFLTPLLIALARHLDLDIVKLIWFTMVIAGAVSTDLKGPDLIGDFLYVGLVPVLISMFALASKPGQVVAT